LLQENCFSALELFAKRFFEVFAKAFVKTKESCLSLKPGALLEGAWFFVIGRESIDFLPPSFQCLS
jgi:hypothetical protein